MSLSAEAGRRGADVRSDCWMKLIPTKSGGIQFQMDSKVKIMYGNSIEQLVLQGLKYFDIANIMVELEDSGALPFAIMARLETAVRRLKLDNGKQWLPEFKEFGKYKTSYDRFRRSRLYLPGNEPKFMMNAGLHKPDGIILDLEDSVAPSEKDAAQILVRNALRQVDFHGAERMVRINQIPQGLEDLKFIVPHNAHIILIPKCETVEQIERVEQEVQRLENENNMEQEIYYMPIIESALGAIRAFDIATASLNTVALTIGLEDYTADIGTQRTLDGRESFWARSQVVNAARAAGIQPIDSVFSDVADMEGLKQGVLEAKSLGFEGKGCIHPRQIQVIHEAFAPAPGEIDKARKIVLAFEQAESQGLGVVSLGSRMIDPPVVKRAQRTIKLAIETGILSSDWREEDAKNS